MSKAKEENQKRLLQVIIVGTLRKIIEKLLKTSLIRIIKVKFYINIKENSIDETIDEEVSNNRLTLDLDNISKISFKPIMPNSNNNTSKSLIKLEGNNQPQTTQNKKANVNNIVSNSTFKPKVKTPIKIIKNEENYYSNKDIILDKEILTTQEDLLHNLTNTNLTNKNVAQEDLNNKSEDYVLNKFDNYIKDRSLTPDITAMKNKKIEAENKVR